jgi:hypothetical protein
MPSAAKPAEEPATDVNAATNAPAADVKAVNGVTPETDDNPGTRAKPVADAKSAAELTQQAASGNASDGTEPVAPHVSVVRPPARPAVPVKAALPPGILGSSEPAVIERPIAPPAVAPVAETAEVAPPAPAPAPPPVREDRRFRAGRPRAEDF